MKSTNERLMITVNPEVRILVLVIVSLTLPGYFAAKLFFYRACTARGKFN